MIDENEVIIDDNVKYYLDGEDSSLQEINERKKTLKNSERIVETTPGTFHLIERMEG